jgi:hypothetical protein
MEWAKRKTKREWIFDWRRSLEFQRGDSISGKNGIEKEISVDKTN